MGLLYKLCAWVLLSSLGYIPCRLPLKQQDSKYNHTNTRKKNPTPPVQLKINVTSPPEDRRCVFTGQLCESHSSPSRKVSGGVRLYVGVFSAGCTPGMSLCSLQWSQASNLRISSDFFSSTQPSPRCFLSLLLRFLFPPPSFHLLSLRGLKTNL